MHKARHVLKTSYKQVAQWHLEVFFNAIQQILISNTNSQLKTILLQHNKSNVSQCGLLLQRPLVGYYLRSMQCNITKFITESRFTTLYDRYAYTVSS